MITRKKSSESRLLATASLALMFVGCIAPSAQMSWQSPLFQDHELVGKIWLSEQDRFVTRAELTSLLEQNPLLLLGEKHDNADHHRLRLELLQTLLLPADQSLVVLEMMQRSQQDRLDALATDDSPFEDTTLATRLAWDTDGWPWEFYGPAVTLALQRGASLRAGNIDSRDIMQVYSDSSDSNTQVLDGEQLAQLERDIDSSHCGLLPPSQFPAMVRVQQARDQQMANVLMSDINMFDQGILLAGNYHIRHDLGVPNYLGESSPGRPLSVAFLEVDPDYTDPEDYLQQFSQQNAYDVIWFTPALRQDDYCAEMSAAREQQAPS